MADALNIRINGLRLVNLNIYADAAQARTGSDRFVSVEEVYRYFLDGLFASNTLFHFNVYFYAGAN